MKQSVFLLVLIVSLSSCTGFQHMHYRKVDKVPAKGFVEAVPLREALLKVPQSSPAADPVHANPPGKTVELKDSVLAEEINNRDYQYDRLVKKKDAKLLPAKKGWSEKLQQKKKASREIRKDHSGLLIIFFLFVGLGLLAVGGTIFVMAFYSLNLLMVLLGLVLILLGLLPFLGLISFFVGDRFSNKNGAYKEK